MRTPRCCIDFFELSAVGRSKANLILNSSIAAERRPLITEDCEFIATRERVSYTSLVSSGYCCSHARRFSALRLPRRRRRAVVSGSSSPSSECAAASSEGFNAVAGRNRGRYTNIGDKSAAGRHQRDSRTSSCRVAEASFAPGPLCLCLVERPEDDFL